ncbi:PH domain-containing protein [Alteromonas gilva]|uniref:PH domain-containing protein n=1 Tax=Alteromonas gilva TaxID=2987522 RepID=A0ABT5L931_9ALTE|nr:PH domain-containing protein [Alteromonas gilva]MDC8832537.1 PH domain-containing protein [Alteromonas gilva]
MVTNLPLQSSELPSLASLPAEPISPRYRILNLGLCVFFTLLITVILVGVRLQPWYDLPVEGEFGVSVAAFGVFILGSLSFGYHFFADRLIFYTIREQDIILYKGLFFKKVICQPVLRIQHIDIQRGPFERYFGLATLKVYSAGGSDHTLAIPGLPKDVAERLRQFVLDHSDLTRD